MNLLYFILIVTPISDFEKPTKLPKSRNLTPPPAYSLRNVSLYITATVAINVLVTWLVTCWEPLLGERQDDESDGSHISGVNYDRMDCVPWFL